MEIRPFLASDERPRILVVEPNRNNLGVMARRLAEPGYRVTTADSGASAIAELYRFPIDLVLAELNMPQMSGAELARVIRGEAQWNDIPVMLITGKSEPKGAVRGYEAGADDVILIHRGRLVSAGPVAGLSRAQGGIVVTTDDIDLLGVTLARRGATVTRTGPSTLSLTGVDQLVVGRAALEVGAVVTDLHAVADDLESIVTDLIQRQEATP